MSAPRQSRRSNRNSLSDISVQHQIGEAYRRSMGVAALWLVDAGTVLLVAAGGIWLGIWSPRWWRSRRRPGPHSRTSLPRPRRRPIEASVARARRLGQLHHASPHGRPRAKVEGVRQAYDEALAECCDAL